MKGTLLRVATYAVGLSPGQCQIGLIHFMGVKYNRRVTHIDTGTHSEYVYAISRPKGCWAIGKLAVMNAFLKAFIVKTHIDERPPLQLSPPFENNFLFV